MTLGYQTLRIDERKTAALLRRVSDENTLWALGALRRGEALPRSAEDAGVLYCPDRASRDLIVLDGPALLEVGTGSCGSIAVLDVGLLRAQAMLEHGVPLPLARGRYGVKLLRRPGAVDIDYWHAVVRTPGGLVDPTVGLRQVCTTPEYA